MFYTLWKPAEIALDVGNWTGHFWIVECTLGFALWNGRLKWVLGYNWFYTFHSVYCRSSLLLSRFSILLALVQGEGCIWQVLLIGLHSMWGFQILFFISEINLFAWGTCSDFLGNMLQSMSQASKMNEIRVKSVIRTSCNSGMICVVQNFRANQMWIRRHWSD
jgi:hypothetical protein